MGNGNAMLDLNSFRLGGRENKRVLSAILRDLM
jgi:hypothetical protein